MLIKLINKLCYLYVMKCYKKKGYIPLGFGGPLENDLGFYVEVTKYGKWITKK